MKVNCRELRNTKPLTLKQLAKAITKNTRNSYKYFEHLLITNDKFRKEK